MMTRTELRRTQRQAFMRGFWRGLAAPIMLFGTTTATAQPMEFKPLPKRAPPVASDWVRVGDALREALRKDRELSRQSGG